MKKPTKQPAPPPQGDRKNISQDTHRRASIVARTLMQMPAKPSK